MLTVLPGNRRTGSFFLFYSCYAAKRKRESKNAGEYKQQDNTESALYISNKHIFKYSYVVYK